LENIETVIRELQAMNGTAVPELRFKDISQRCGFASPTSFTRTFQRETGQTPTEWFSAQNNLK